MPEARFENVLPPVVYVLNTGCMLGHFFNKDMHQFYIFFLLED
jgi:hypothetical protein